MSDEESDSRETEGEKALKKRREQTSAELDENDQDLLQQNMVERDQMMNEIQELRERSEKRKQEREIEEKRLAAERAAEDSRRKAEEEERKRKKEEEEHRRREERMLKMAEFEKWKNPPKANFVISKKLAAAASGEEADTEQGEGKARKSKEQLEAEKQAILRQRIKPVDIDGADSARLTEKLKEYHSLITRLEGEKYDLEKRYKTMQGQLQQLAELARQANKVGRDGLKRVDTGPDDADKFKERFAAAPSKVEMYSKYERQKDKRTYGDRKVLYTGPQYLSPAERIKPNKVVAWNEEGVPIYSEDGQEGGHPAEGGQ